MDIAVPEDAADSLIDLRTYFDDPDVATNSDQLSFCLVVGNTCVPMAPTNPLLDAQLSDAARTPTASGDHLLIDYKAEQHGTFNLTIRAED